MKHRIRVATIIINDNKILLVKHVHPETGYTWWVPPGGGIEEFDSSIFDCAKREAFEETNLTIENSRILYIRPVWPRFNHLNLKLLFGYPNPFFCTFSPQWDFSSELSLLTTFSCLNST